MRFYTNPFRKDAETVWQVSASDPKYDGVTITAAGTYQTWSRDVTYSDGSVRSEEVERRSLGPDYFAFLVRPGKGVAVRGRRL